MPNISDMKPIIEAQPVMVWPRKYWNQDVAEFQDREAAGEKADPDPEFERREGEREDRARGEAQHLFQAVLGGAAEALVGAVGQRDRTKAEPGDRTADEQIDVVHVAQSAHGGGVEQAEVRIARGHGYAGEFGEHAVEPTRAGAFEQGTCLPHLRARW